MHLSSVLGNDKCLSSKTLTEPRNASECRPDDEMCEARDQRPLTDDYPFDVTFPKK